MLSCGSRSPASLPATALELRVGRLYCGIEDPTGRGAHGSRRGLGLSGVSAPGPASVGGLLEPLPDLAECAGGAAPALAMGAGHGHGGVALQGVAGPVP